MVRDSTHDSAVSRPNEYDSPRDSTFVTRQLVSLRLTNYVRWAVGGPYIDCGVLKVFRS